MPCHLCKKDVKLCRSHIISEFLYETIYNEKHKLSVLSTKPDLANYHEQKGLREALLCEVCEQKLSIWEQYAKQVLTGGTPIDFHREENILFVSGVNYEKFKLFHMSILWRASISTLPFFKNVRLGDWHTECLRQLLLKGDPGTQELYGCVMMGLKFQNQPFTDSIMQPTKTRMDGRITYKFNFGGFLWAMIAANHSYSPLLKRCVLNEKGELALIVKDVFEMDDFTSFAQDLSRLGRLPK